MLISFWCVIYGEEASEKVVEEFENIYDCYWEHVNIEVYCEDYDIVYEECLVSYTEVGLEEEMENLVVVVVEEEEMENFVL